METVFRSKVDLWLVIVAVAVPVVMLEFILEGLNTPEKFAELLALVIVVAVLGIFAWLYFSTRYTITGDFLLVKAGPFSWVIPIEDIVSVEPTRNPSSSPALSLDRLVIRYGRSAALMISPKDKDGFMKELKKHLKPNPATVNLEGTR
ncbi:MAG: PH domain-containing protein [Candidatus Binatia bacterium]